VLDKNGWVKIKGAMAHKTDKSLYRVSINSGCLDMTEDHALILNDDSCISPVDSLGLKGQIIKAPSLESTSKISKELAYFYGMFVAEGTANVYLRKKKGDYQYQFNVYNKDISLLEKCQAGLLELGYASVIKMYSSSKEVYTLTPYTENRRVGLTKKFLTLKFIEECYTARKEKRVPEFILNADLEAQTSFLDGFFAGDGIKNKREVYKNEENRQRPFVPHNTGRKYHSCEIKGQTLASGLTYLLRIVGTDLITISSVNRLQGTGWQSYYRIYEKAGKGQGVTWIKDPLLIKKVEKLEHKEEVVYDFYTESGTFCAGINNVLIHNSNIEPGDRKTVEVNTQIQVTAIQSLQGLLARNTIGRLPVVGDWINDTPTTPAVENGVVSVLIDTVKEMYQGEFSMFAQPTIKPRDLILITDHRNNMKGPVLVKEVLHKMNCQEGFITVITPDAVVIPHSSQLGGHMIESLISGALHRLGGFMVYRTLLASTYGWKKTTAHYTGVLKKMKNLDIYNQIINGEGLDEMIGEKKKSVVSDMLKEAADEEISKLDKTNAKTYKASVEAIQERLKADNLDIQAGKIDKVIKERNLKVDVIDKLANQFIEDTRAFEVTQLEKLKIRIAQIRAGQTSLTKTYTEEEAIQAAVQETNTFRNLHIVLNSANIKGIKDAISQLDKSKELEAAIKAATTARELVTQLASDVNTPRGILNKARSEADALEGDVNDLAGKLKQFVGLAHDDTLSNDQLMNLVNRGKFVDFVLANGEKPVYSASVLGDIPGTYFSRLPTGKINLQMKMMGLKAQKDAFIAGTKATVEEVKGVINTAKTVGGAEALVEAKALASLKIGRSWEILRDLYTGFRVAKYCGPQALLSLCVDTVQLIAWGSLIDGINARLGARNVAKLYPLMVGDIPFVAGIRGHSGLVVGDDPSWADQLLTGVLTPTDPNWHSMSNLTGFVALLAGIQVPDRSVSDSDARYIRVMQDQ